MNWRPCTLGHMVDLVPCYSLEEVLERGERGESDISLLPVENSIEGTVGRTLICLSQLKSRYQQKFPFQ